MFDLVEMEKIFRAVTIGKIWFELKKKLKKLNSSEIISFLKKEDKSITDFIDMVDINKINEIDFFEQEYLLLDELRKLNPISFCLRQLRTYFISQINNKKAFTRTSKNLYIYRNLYATRYALRYCIHRLEN